FFEIIGARQLDCVFVDFDTAFLIVNADVLALTVRVAAEYRATAGDVDRDRIGAAVSQIPADAYRLFDDDVIDYNDVVATYRDVDVTRGSATLLARGCRNVDT